jgi:hypothetical protein
MQKWGLQSTKKDLLRKWKMQLDATDKMRKTNKTGLNRDKHHEQGWR